MRRTLHRVLGYFVIFSLLGLGSAVPLFGAGVSGPSIRGRVVDENLQPLQGVIFEVLESETPRAEILRLLRGEEAVVVAEARSDAKGWYRFSLPSAGFYHLRASQDGRLSPEFKLFPILEDWNLPRLVLPELTEMTVTVRDPEGKPVEDAWVWVGRQSIQTNWGLPQLWDLPPVLVRANERGQVRLPRSKGDSAEVIGWSPAYEEGKGAVAAQVELQLKKAIPRSLQIVGASLQPLEGVMVLRGKAQFPAGFSDQVGSIELASSPGKNLSLLLFPDDGPGLVHVLPTHRPKVKETLEMEQGMTVHGRVLDATTGRDLSGALVWTGEENPLWVRSGRGGGFSLPAKARKEVLQAAARGYFTNRSIVRPQNGVPPAIPLYPSSTVRGWVEDARGKPIAGAEVSAKFKPIGFRRLAPGLSRATMKPPSARSDEKGTFSLNQMVPNGPYEILVRHPEWAEGQALVTVAESSVAPVEIRVVLEEGSRAEGYVGNAAGEPVAGATLTLWRSREELFETSESMATTRTDSEGRYAWSFLPQGSFDLEVKAPGYAGQALSGLKVSSPWVEWEEIILEKSLDLVGRVVDRDGEGLGGVAIYLREAETANTVRYGSIHESIRSLTAADGSFLIDDLTAEKRVSLYLSREGYGSTSVEGIALPLEKLLEVEMPPASRLEGRVVDEEGNPIAKILVAAEPKEGDRMGRGSFDRVETADDGLFVFEGLGPGAYAVSARGMGYQRANLAGLEIRLGEDLLGIEIPMKPGFVLSGTVQSEVNGPVVEARVTARAPNKGRGSGASGYTDGEGRFRLEGLASGPLEVSARHAAYVEVRQKVEIENADLEVEIEFLQGVSVSGLVLSRSGEPLAGASVRLQRASSFRGDLEVTSGADGRFVLEGVPPGAWLLLASSAGFAEGRLTEPLEVKDQPVAGLEVRLSRGTTLVGEVRGLTPDELSRVEVMVYGREKGSRDRRLLTIDAQGAYRSENLGPGEWSLYGSVEGKTQSVTLTVGPEALEIHQDLEFQEGLTLAGVVLSDAGPQGGLRVFVSGTDTSGYGASLTDHEGRFEIQGLAADHYTLRVWKRSGDLHEEKVELQAHREIEIRLEGGGSLNGFVVDGDTGMPLGALEVVLSRPEPADGSRAESKGENTDSSGFFAFLGVAEGEWRLMVSAAGYEPLEFAVDMAEGVDLENISLEMVPRQAMRLRLSTSYGPAPTRVTIAATGSDGAPLGMTFWGQVTSDGWVDLHRIPSASANLLISVAGFALVEVMVAPDLEPEVTLVPGASLRLRVPDLEEERLNAKFRLLSTSGHRLQWPNYPRGTRDELVTRLGRSNIQSIPPGFWRVEVEATDGRLWTGEFEAVANQHHQLTLD